MLNSARLTTKKYHNDRCLKASRNNFFSPGASIVASNRKLAKSSCERKEGFVVAWTLLLYMSFKCDVTSSKTYVGAGPSPRTVREPAAI